MPGQFLMAPQCRFCCAKCPFCGGGRTIHTRYTISAEISGAANRTGAEDCRCLDGEDCAPMNKSLSLSYATGGVGGSIGFFDADDEIVTYEFPGKWCRFEGTTSAVTGCRNRSILVRLWLYENETGGVDAISFASNTATFPAGGCGSESFGQGTTDLDPEADCAETYSFTVPHTNVRNLSSWCTAGTAVTYDLTKIP